MVVVALLCASTAQAKTHAGLVKGAVRTAQGPFDAMRSYQLTYRLTQQGGLAVAEYRFMYKHKPNARFLGSKYGARNIPFSEVRATVPKWVVLEARVRFFGAAGKQDGSGKIYLLADDLRAAGSWSNPSGPKRIIPWRRLFHNVKTRRTLRDALPSDRDFAAKLNRELLLSSSRIVIDQPKLIHAHYGKRVWRAFARAHWRGHKQRLAKLPSGRFWAADPVRTTPTIEPGNRAHKDAAAIYRLGIPVPATGALNTRNALTVSTPYNGRSVYTTTVNVSGSVQHVWRRLAKRVAITLHGKTTFAKLTANGRFSQKIAIKPGYNRIKVELDGPAHKISKLITVNKYVRPRRALYWVCMQTFTEEYKPYKQRFTKSFVSRVFTTYYTTTSQRTKVQNEFKQFVFKTYGNHAGWRAYGSSCTPYTAARYAHNRYRSYAKYANPNSRDRQRYRRLPGAIVNFRFKEQP